MRLVVLYLLFIVPVLTSGQELIWEKKIPLSNYETLLSIIKTSDGNYLAAGYTDRWRVIAPQNVYGGAVLIKFDENGDTLWTKFTGYYGGINQMVHLENGLIYATIAYRDFTFNIDRWGLLVLTENGNILTLIPLTDQNIAGIFSLKYKDGYLWLAGEKNPSLFYPNASLSFDFLLIKMRLDGTEVFSFVYNANDQTCRGKKIEFMPSGNILFSGAVGNRIGAFEIDTAGSQVQYRTYFTNNFNSGWQNPDVSQMAEANRFISGNRNTNPTSHYIGKHDTSGTRIWGGFGLGGISTPMIFTDGSIIHTSNSYNPLFSKIRRISSDSTLLWSLDLTGPGLIQGRKAIRETWYESDSSGICIGSMVSNPGGAQNLYIAKFGGFGIPFDPSSAKAMENQKTNARPIPFPNPGRDVVKFTILAGPGKVSFTDMKGRKVFDGEYLPEKGISSKGFPAGIYNYRLERNGKVWGGKWVKE